MLHNSSQLERLKSSEVFQLAEYVVQENYKHHLKGVFGTNYKMSVRSIFKQEFSYLQNSQIFVVKNHLGSISASIRVLKWNYKDILPIQHIFNINPLDNSFVKGPNGSIYHIGRFAIKKEVQSILLFKKLLCQAISVVCEDKNNVAYAECDSKLFRILNLLGIKVNVLGKSIDYLGSETIPIMMNYEGLIRFYENNCGLIKPIQRIA